MATAPTTPPVHPGDILQDSDGLLYLASEIHNWGVGAVMRWRVEDQTHEHYFRLKPGQFTVVGTAHLLPEEVAQRRRDSLAQARMIAMESPAYGASDSSDPFQWAINAATQARAWGGDAPTAIAEAAQKWASTYPGLALEIGK